MLRSHYKLLPEAGTDEAGRGCLAGPVTAAAVMLPEEFSDERLDDSKKLSPKTRNLLRPVIERDAVCYGIAHIPPQTIDEVNILNASFLAMHRALDLLAICPAHIIVDGNRFKGYRDIPHMCIIQGDGKFGSIAAASVLAKTYRDAYMQRIHREFPMYNWKQNKGYPTREHREAIAKFGLTKYHRLSFRMEPAYADTADDHLRIR